MWNEPKLEELNRLPKLYETESVELQDKIIQMHFFIGGTDYYVAEFDGDDMMWGFVILNGDMQMAEWGYISLSEIKDIRCGFVEVDFDLHWKPVKAIDIQKIKEAQMWG